MKFADFHPGMIIEAGPRRIEEAEMLAFARSYDPQWFHVDGKAAGQGRFGALIASGWQTCGIAMDLAVRAALHDSSRSPRRAWSRCAGPTRCWREMNCGCVPKCSRRGPRAAGPNWACCAGAGIC